MIKTFKNHRPINSSLSWEEKNPEFYTYRHSDEVIKLKRETNRIKQLLNSES